MNELALFAGAGGGILGGKLLGWKTVCAVEIDQYARQVLMQRQNDGILDPFPIWDDVQTFDGRAWRGTIDLVSGGFPCTDISCANSKGEGTKGEKSGLWSEMARIIREVAPRNVFVENSPMLTVRGLGDVLGDLAQMGYHAGWGVLGADDAGLLHRRKRMWIAAHATDKPIQANAGREWAERIRERATVWRKSVSVGWGKSLPPIPRMANGLGGGMDSNRAIGNGQVLSVVAGAWEILGENNVYAQRNADMTQ